ncbi:flagellar biosynthetic protein FliO [Gallaecimonas xiamenensis]|uniref:Flagellar biosynthetic protein FliO n=1 Tax=Gallaecimonas xiamenensis 3-C-1 TaxID=745411 RepID=K2IY53_9GAMM|nr:flagellar biosynthetic protein FliO [Gallaecimonas xiamenensis]EKE75411.1 flagellar biosynthetic protein FliO [Gallaecimonas xiamenensis 3-C-1]
MMSWLYGAASLAADQTPMVNPTDKLGTLVLSLVGVVVLLVGLLYFARRHMPQFKAGPIKIVAQQQLGARSRLLLVEVGQEQMLISVSGTDVRLIKALDNPVKENG